MYYKTHAFLSAQIAHAALTIVDVTYSDFTKLLKIRTVLRTFTRSIFTHALHHANSQSHPLEAVKLMNAENYD